MKQKKRVFLASNKMFKNIVTLQSQKRMEKAKCRTLQINLVKMFIYHYVLVKKKEH